MGNTPKKIKVRGAKVHNLKNINVDIPLNQIVAIAGCFRVRKIITSHGCSL